MQPMHERGRADARSRPRRDAGLAAAIVAALAGMLMLVAYAHAADAEKPHEYIYGAELMTPAEREAYRKEMSRDTEAAKKAQTRERHRARMRLRAGQRGVDLVEPEGIVKPKPGQRDTQDSK